MTRLSSVPAFGQLQGLKVLSCGSVVAQPYAALMMAENGATVIQLESTIAPDTIRGIKPSWATERRNEFEIMMNIPTPEGKELLFKLVKWADIFMESAKGGTWKKWGLTDEVLWEHNPRLVIGHVSGFGQEGVEKYVNRASYDAIGQAFGGYMYVNGLPAPNPPMRANPYTCDYVTAINLSWSCLAAYIRVQKTGKGESVDIAQFEMMAKIMFHYPQKWLNNRVQLQRQGNSDPSFGGYSAYKCKDGNYVFIGLVGGGPIKKAKKVLGIPADDPLIPDGIQICMHSNGAGKAIDEYIQKFCDQYDAQEVDRIFLENDIPASTIYNFEMAENDPHYKAREVFTEWEDKEFGPHFKGVNIQPRYKNERGKIWKSAPLVGEDNDDILEEFGYTREQIEDLYAKGIIKKDLSMAYKQK